MNTLKINNFSQIFQRIEVTDKLPLKTLERKVNIGNHTAQIRLPGGKATGISNQQEHLNSNQ